MKYILFHFVQNKKLTETQHKVTIISQIRRSVLLAIFRTLGLHSPGYDKNKQKYQIQPLGPQ